MNCGGRVTMRGIPRGGIGLRHADFCVDPSNLIRLMPA